MTNETTHYDYGSNIKKAIFFLLSLVLLVKCFTVQIVLRGYHFVALRGCRRDLQNRAPESVVKREGRPEQSQLIVVDDALGSRMRGRYEAQILMKHYRK